MDLCGGIFWCLFEEGAARNGHRDKGKRDQDSRAVRQLAPRPMPFGAARNLCFREDLLGGMVHAASTTDDRYVAEPVVTTLLFVGARQQRLSRNLGPYSNDAEYSHGCACSRTNRRYDVSTFSRDSDARQLQRGPDRRYAKNSRSAETFEKSRRCVFHHDSDIPVDPTMYKVMGITDWERAGMTGPGTQVYSVPRRAT